MKKILFYTNQFFGQIGGEEMAGVPPELREGPVGPGLSFKPKLEGEIVNTIVCGDNYYAENMEAAKKTISGWIDSIRPDLFLAGPAFNAGRFGVACGDIGAWVSETYGIPAVTGLYEENPAVEMYKDKLYILSVGKNAAAIRQAVPAMAALSNKLLRGETIGLPGEEGYFPRGIRVNVFHERTGAQRAVDMLLSKLKGEPYESETPIPVYTAVKPAAPIPDLAKAKIALLTSGGMVPMGNPDRLPAATAKFYRSYDISGVDALEEGRYESVHAGFDPVYVNNKPGRVAPVDLLKRFEQEGRIGSLYGYLVSTTGNSTSVADATRMGKEIARQLLDAGVSGAIMTST